MYNNRVLNLRREMKKQAIDLVILSHSTDLFYTTGIRGRLLERLACFILTQTEIHFIAPAFEINDPSCDGLSLESHGWDDGQDPFALVKMIVPAGLSLRAAIGKDVPSWVLIRLIELFPNFTWISAENLFRDLRSSKDDFEYRLLKQVQEKATNALVKVMEHGVLGMKEIEVSRLLIDYCAQEGIKSDGGIVASGPNSAIPHHFPTERTIENGDVVVIDFGGEEDGIGYQADTTRTFCVGHIPEGFEEIYQLTRKANQAAYEAAKPGLPCQELDKVARDIITKGGYGKYFTHRLGHGIGLDIHEDPYISADNPQLLQVGHAFSNEPGIYIPGKYGVRIEDILFLHASGAERLTPTYPPLDHELKIVG